MKALALALFLAGAPAALAASASSIPLEPMAPDLEDLPSLQRGMTLFMNYCAGCHSLKYQRYERTARDLGIPLDVAADNLIFTEAPIGALIETAMPAESKGWFGAPPPDLTMVDQVRGTAWVYTMLKSFYADPSRPFGANNLVFENINMPHVLVGLQGVPHRQQDGYEPLNVLDNPLATGTVEPSPSRADRNRLVPERVPRYRYQVAPGSGSMTGAEYDQAAYDIANFLHYVGEPGRAKRQQLGVYVLLFLALLFVFATLLNREYWKDVKT